MTYPWLAQYPAGVAAEVDPAEFPSLAAMLTDCFERHALLPACRFMGKNISFEQLGELSLALAAWLQSEGLRRGDRVAVMLPNVPQYPVAVAAIWRAGGVVVNINPFHPPAELAHQLKDSGAKAIVVMENCAAALQAVLPAVPLQKMVVAAVGDMLGSLKGPIVNYVERSARRAVPPFELAGARRFNDAVNQGRSLHLEPPRVGAQDIALLQYTGGTTGVSKAAVLLHRNLMANLLQARAWFQPALQKLPAGEQWTTVCALPLHQLFGFNMSMMLSLLMGGCSLLMARPRDVPTLLKELVGERFHSFPAVNALFNAVAQHANAGQVDWSSLKLCLGGGMAVQPDTARLWQELTGCPICEGYGLTETGASVTCNPVELAAFTGHIGVPLPSTVLRILNDAGQGLAAGEVGEIGVKGPQVMAGYWLRPDETARVMTADGFFRTGDLGLMDDNGNVHLIDRKKDVILVSGMNVYPNEVEDVIAAMPGVLEVAAVGIPDPRAGEAVKVVIVKKHPAISEDDVRAYSDANLSGYKRPTLVEFRSELPKSSVGKVLRRELRM